VRKYKNFAVWHKNWQEKIEWSENVKKEKNIECYIEDSNKKNKWKNNKVNLYH
jgi:hypothetical protein